MFHGIYHEEYCLKTIHKKSISRWLKILPPKRCMILKSPFKFEATYENDNNTKNHFDSNNTNNKLNSSNKKSLNLPKQYKAHFFASINGNFVPNIVRNFKGLLYTFFVNI